MIAITEVTKRFGDKEALAGITLEIPDGGIYGIVGSNGAGKSTLLRVLAGIHEPESGAVRYDGEAVPDNTELLGQMAYVSDNVWFPPFKNLRQIAKFYRRYYKSFSMERFEDLVKRLGIDTETEVRRGSRGMQKQAAMALAIAKCPKDYLLDETLDGLDIVMRDAVKEMLFDDLCERQATVIITSHSLRELENMCDRLALLHQGKLILESDVESMKESLVKLQLALNEPVTKEQLEAAAGVPCVSFERNSKTVTAVLRMDRAEQAELERRLAVLHPLMTEVAPLGLEELFLSEMKANGYSVKRPEEKGEAL